jgi:hypothetical protein
VAALNNLLFQLKNDTILLAVKVYAKDCTSLLLYPKCQEGQIKGGER